MIFAVNQTIVKFCAESEYDIYFSQELLENVQIEHFMIPPLFDKNKLWSFLQPLICTQHTIQFHFVMRVRQGPSQYDSCYVLYSFYYIYNSHFVNAINPQSADSERYALFSGASCNLRVTHQIFLNIISIYTSTNITYDLFIMHTKYSTFHFVMRVRRDPFQYDSCIYYCKRTKLIV